jgi:hypothetical protein
MSTTIFSANGTTYHIIQRQPWNGPGVNGSVVAGEARAYHVQAENGELFGFIVQFPFTIGSGICTDSEERDAQMIKLAFETDLEGVRKRGRTTQYEINARQPPYAALL